MNRNIAALQGAVAASLLFLGGAAIAAPPAKPPTPQAALPDDPAKVAAAREFILVSHPRTDPKAIAAIIDRNLPRMIARAKAADPKLDAAAFGKEYRQRALHQASMTLDIMSHAVARHFTMPEIRDLTAFYRSPLGQKLTEQTPYIQNEVMMAKRADNEPPLPSMRRMLAPPPAQAPKPQPHK
jgi:hypothetical protein